MPPEVDQVDAEAARAAAEAEFASVDEGVKSEVKPDPKPESNPVVDPKIAEEAAAKAATEAEWEGVPDKVRQKIEAIYGKVGALDKIEHRLKGVEGRTGAALERVHELKTAFDAAKSVKNDGGSAPTQEQIAAASSSDEEWNALLEDFPEWSNGIDKRINHLVEGRLSRLSIPDAAVLKTELTGSVQEIIAKATSDAKAEARELAKIDRRHETWTSDIFVNGVDSSEGFTPAFDAWQAAQPPEIRSLGASPKASDAIKMLDSFYQHQKTVADATAKADKSKKRLESAITPRGGASPATRTPSEEEAMQAAFESVDN